MRFRNILVALLIVAFSATACANGPAEPVFVALDILSANGDDDDDDRRNDYDEDTNTDLWIAMGVITVGIVAGILIGYGIHEHKADKAKKKKAAKVIEDANSVAAIAPTELDAEHAQKYRKTECPMNYWNYRDLRQRIQSGVELQFFYDYISSQQVADLMPLISSEQERGRVALLMYDTLCDPDNFYLVYDHIHDIGVLMTMEKKLGAN